MKNKLFDKFKIKEDKSENSLQVQEIKIPDLKQYLVDGYNEIRQVREELEKTIKERELTKKYEEQRKEIRDNLIEEFVEKIQNEKGNLSKSKIIDLLKEVK